MPESYGKRQRKQVKAKKATAREERRLARNQRKADREAGIRPRGPQEGEPPERIDPAELEGLAPSSQPDPEPTTP
jgi:hypothetical protein